MALETYGKKIKKNTRIKFVKYFSYIAGGTFVLLFLWFIISSSNGVEDVSVEDSVYEPIDEKVPTEDSDSWIGWLIGGYIVFGIIITTVFWLGGAEW